MPAKRMPALLLTLCAALAILPGAAGAASYYVQADGGGDFPTIGAALFTAISGDVIELGNGVFTGPGNRDLDFAGKAITLRSQSGQTEACIIDAGGSAGTPHRIFGFRSEETALTRIDGITLRGGHVNAGTPETSGGAILCDGSSPQFTDCIIEGNSAVSGGAIHCWASSPGFTDCEIRDNGAVDFGGAVLCEAESAPSFDGCLIAGNSAGRGGGFFCLEARPHFNDCVIVGNAAMERGGGLYLGNGTLCRIDACTLAYNEAPLGAGIDAILNANALLSRSLLVFGVVGGALSLSFGSAADFECSNIFGNEGGDWTGEIAGQLGQSGNIGADPEFCGTPGSGNYFLQSDSPSAAAQSACGNMGAMNVGCSTTAVRPGSWSVLKRLYSR